MRFWVFRTVLVAGLLGVPGGLAQVVHQPVPVERPAGSSVGFKFAWNQGRPWTSYTITVADSGDTHFDGAANPIDGGDGDDYGVDFTMSEAGRQKIFDLAKKADYFQGTLEGKAKNIAKTGEKTLEYHGVLARGGAAATSATYNYSGNTDVQELTRYFQAVATTIDFGRKLAFDYRFDKLGMDAHLHSLQEMQASHFAEEIQAIEPILLKIANDPNMMHISRVTAKQLLKSIGSTVAAEQPSVQP